MNSTYILYFLKAKLNKRRTEKKDENCHGWREEEGHA
jgi:hypothetical protein